MGDRNAVVGIDIGSHSIKLVELQHAKKGWELKNFGLIGLPPQTIVDGAIKDQAALAVALRELGRNLKIRNKNVAAAISGYSVIVKKITLPQKKSAELEASIHEEAEQYIPFDLNDVNLDFDILPARSAPAGDPEGAAARDSQDMDVLLVAAKKDIVSAYVDVCEAAGLNPVILDIDAFAMQNALETTSAEDLSGCYAAINIGAQQLNVTAVQNGVPLFTRDFSYGGLQITERIMSEFKLSFEEAERLKLGAAPLEDKAAGFSDILRTTVQEWGLEIKRVLEFVASTYSHAETSRLFVCGGSCRLPGLQAYLERETGIKVIEIDPFKNISVDAKRVDPQYLRHVAPAAVLAVGLALRRVGDK